ncbi:MAG: ATP-dependent RecD-like DNA helicase, partial [Acidobacteria bacterium]
MQTGSTDQSPSSIEAVVQRITYSNEENGYSVVRLLSVEDRDFTAVGTMLGIAAGDRLRLSGNWTEHPKFGEQFKVESFLEILPSTLDGIRVFLGSGRVRGVGPVTAELLINTFGLEVLDIIEHQPDRLLEIRGIGPATVEKISASWAKNRGIQRIMVFLAGHGISPGIAVRLHRRYGESALAVIRENPYRLAEEVYGVGFLTADRIAQKLGIASDAPERLAAGLLHALSQAAIGGNLFLPREVLISAAQGLLDEPDVDLEGIIDALRRSGHVVVRSREGESEAVFTTRLDRAEETLAVGVARLLASEVDFRKTLNAGRLVKWFSDAINIDLAKEQERSLVTAIERPVTIVTGGPGTGKTTLVKGLVKIFGRYGLKILLAAPTGRAAKRLEEASGKEARTLHRLLEFNPVERAWGRNAENPLEADCIVVDEVSMLDVELGARLVEAVPSGCRLVLVGDADQLPSVGPGDVLADLIKSGVVDVIRLQRIFRQGEGSLIAENAHRINRGQMPVYGSPNQLADFYFAVRSDVGEAATTAVEMAAGRIPRRFDMDPLTDIQVLAPMHRGEAGV